MSEALYVHCVDPWPDTGTYSVTVLPAGAGSATTWTNPTEVNMSVRFEALQIGDRVRITRDKEFYKVITLFPGTQEVELEIGKGSCRFSVTELAEVRR